ncbi:MAG: hypothetical protein V1725_02205 [archaeon]
MHARHATTDDLHLLEQLVSEIPPEEELLSFNRQNYRELVDHQNVWVFLYLDGNDVFGMGLLKRDVPVSFVHNKHIYTKGENGVRVVNNPNYGKEECIDRNMYIGGAWIRPAYRGNGHYTYMFRHRFEYARMQTTESHDGMQRAIITEPFGSCSRTGQGERDVPRKSSQAVYTVALNHGFAHVGYSKEWDQGPTLLLPQ